MPAADHPERGRVRRIVEHHLHRAADPRPLHHEGQRVRAHPERLTSALPNDAIFPYFIVNEMPRGLVGLIIAGLFAAAMGALSSALNATAAIMVSDFYGTLRPATTETERGQLARRATLIAGVVATAMAAIIASLHVESLWDQFLKLVALIGGGFPGVFALGLLTRRANAPGVMVGAVVSIAVTWWVQNFTATNVFLHGFVAVGTCVIVGYAASFCFRARRPAESSDVLTLWDLGPSRRGGKDPRSTGETRAM